MNKKKRIMILGASVLQLPAIIKAKDMGHEVIAVDMDENAIGLKHADHQLIISTNNVEAVLSAADELMIDGIMTLASDMPMRTVAAVSEKLNLIGISMETALNATDKARMRDVLNKNGIPIPNYYRVRDFDDLRHKVNDFKGKFILKPTDNSGSRGIYLINDPTDKNELLFAFKYSASYAKDGSIIVEDYMIGPEVSVETLTYNGVTDILAITDKLTTGSPRFVEMGHSQPSILPIKIKEEIESITKRAVKALGINFGPAHTEIIITKQGPKIVEIGARMGGDNITTHLVPLSTGIDMISACINISLGMAPDLNGELNLGSAIRYMKIQPGIIKKIDGIDLANEIDGIKGVYISKEVGDTVEETINSASRIGYVISQGDSATHAIELCNKALSELSIVLEKDCEKK